MNEKPIISVIVPVYNVKPYLRKCLNSLKRQTLKQIEVICIDDGSTDESGAIADEYISAEWPRFRCIHTENHGLSAARNRGIDEAEADWVMFVDSDDWVHKDYCRIPYKAACKYGADMVIFDFAYDHKRNIERNTQIQLGVVDFETAIRYSANTAWRRLYRKDLSRSIRYPEGRVFEDVLTTYKLIHEAEKIVRLNNRLYYYRVRKGSISHTQKGFRQREYLEALLEKRDGLRAYGYRPEELMLDSLQETALRFLTHTQRADDRLHREAEKIVDSIKGYPNSLSKQQKIALFLWRRNRTLFEVASSVFRR